MLGPKTSFFVTFAIASTLIYGTFAPVASAEIYRIDLKDPSSKVIATRLLDTEKSSGAVSHVAGGMAVEVNDKQASCGVYIQPQTRESGPRAADVMVSLIRNSGPIETRMVSSNSAVLAKRKISESERDVLPNSSGQRSVSVEAEILRRSCTVSVL